MISREAFINKIRELDFTFKRQQRRTFLWRQRAGRVRIVVPKADLLEEEFVAINLRRAGLDEAAIKKFIGEAKS